MFNTSSKKTYILLLYSNIIFSLVNSLFDYVVGFIKTQLKFKLIKEQAGKYSIVVNMYII